MTSRILWKRTASPLAIAAVVALAIAICARTTTAQPPDQRPASPRAAAPIELTGYWVSVVTEDWRWRMVTPAKGDFASVPLNDEGIALGEVWDPAADQAAGLQCKAYGVGGIMRMPGRVHFTWEDDQTLRIDIDAGQQTRLLHFDGSPSPSGERTWQGRSVAEWETPGGGRRGRRGGRRGGGGGGTRGGGLKVVTTQMRAGYLRRNGVPYSENAVVTEYFDRHAAYGDEWFTVTTIVEDPQYLMQPFITSSHFKREPDDAKWRPTPCEAT